MMAERQSLELTNHASDLDSAMVWHTIGEERSQNKDRIGLR